MKPKLSPSLHACRHCSLNPLCQLPLSAYHYPFIHQTIKECTPLQKREILFQAGQPFDKLAVLRTGRMIALNLTSGQRDVTGFYLATELIGLEGLARGVYPSTIQALDTAVLCYIDYSSLVKALPEHPEIYQPWLELTSRGFCQKQRIHPHHNAEERLQHFLQDLSQRFAQAGFSAQHFELPLSQKDIANYLGLSPETLSRLFALFKERQWLELKDKTLFLLGGFFQGISA